MRRLLVAVALLPILAACGSDTDAYCDAVADAQQELSGIVASGDADALLQALDPLEDLRERAPQDIEDEWAQVLTRIEALADALATAEVDPGDYDRDDPPPGVTAEERTAIDAAARELAGPATVRALADLDQHARDVCHTPLTR